MCCWGLERKSMCRNFFFLSQGRGRDQWGRGLMEGPSECGRFWRNSGLRGVDDQSLSTGGSLSGLPISSGLEQLIHKDRVFKTKKQKSKHYERNDC